MAVDKFGRNYVLNVQTKSGSTITIKPPFTIEFDITRNILTSANVSSIRIFNLSANHRSQLRKNINDYGSARLIQLLAGYGQNPPVVFTGNITQAWSVREGTNFVTQVESFDGGFAFANSYTNKSFPAGTPQQTVIKGVMQDFIPNGVTVGAVGSFPGTLGRGNAHNGTTVEVMKQLTGGNFFVDNGIANAIGNTEYIAGPVTTIDYSTGLLGTPIREETYINFDMLFEPRLLAGQKVYLQSVTDEFFRGDYKVVSIKHRGMISDSVCGNAITSVGVFPASGFTMVTPS